LFSDAPVESPTVYIEHVCEVTFSSVSRLIHLLLLEGTYLSRKNLNLGLGHYQCLSSQKNIVISANKTTKQDIGRELERKVKTCWSEEILLFLVARERPYIPILDQCDWGSPSTKLCICQVPADGGRKMTTGCVRYDASQKEASICRRRNSMKHFPNAAAHKKRETQCNVPFILTYYPRA
jgi:hypothetical protein